MAPPPHLRLPRLVQTLLFLRSPEGLMRRAHQGRHAAFTVRVLGAPPLVYLADPALVRELFGHDGDEGLAGEARRPYFEPLVGPNSLLVTDGDRWFTQRKLIGPPLHGRRIGTYREQISAIASEEADRWPTGEPVALRPRMQRITLEVILRVVFGIEEGPDRERLRTLLPLLIQQGQWLVWAPPRIRDPLIRLLERRPRLRRVVPLGSTLDVRDEVDRILYRQIARRRELAGSGERDDVLTLLIEARDEAGEGMSDVELRDQLVTLLEAGHETTATALAWAFERLARNPQALGRLREELAEPGAGRGYTEAVVKETLRSRPVVVDTIRKLRAPLRIGDYEIPAGWYVGPATALIHQLDELHPDAAEFRPERFLAEDPPFAAWFPFGGGARRCVGSSLAQLEMTVVIEEVMDRFEIAPVSPEPERPRVQHVTQVPARKARVVLTPRPAPTGSAAGAGR